MSDESTSSSSPLRKALDSLYVRIPELVLAAIGGFGVLIFSLWLSNRDLADRLAAVDAYINKDTEHMEQLADCVKRPECEAVRSLVHAHDIRINAAETRLTNHEAVSRERVERITELEREVRRITTQPTARPDPFTGTEGRELRGQIDTLQRQMRDLQADQGQGR